MAHQTTKDTSRAAVYAEANVVKANMRCHILNDHECKINICDVVNL